MRSPFSFGVLSLLACCSLALGGCAANPDAADDSGESAATSTSDREIAHVGGDGRFAIGSDGAYFIFNGALERVNAKGEQDELAEVPAYTEALAVTDRYVVVASSPLTAHTLTFYDRTNQFSPKTTVVLDSSVIDMVPTADDRVVVSSMDEGVYVVGVSGRKRVLYQPGKYLALRDLKSGATADTVYGLVSTVIGQAEGHDLVEVKVRTGKSRVVFHVDKGSFTYTYDRDTDTFFTERSHMDLPEQSVLTTYDHNGNVLATVETPLNTFGAVAVDGDAFYLAARPGKSPGVGSWKIFAYDKTTLEARDTGRVEPQVYEMNLHGHDLYYVHSKGSSSRLRVRSL